MKSLHNRFFLAFLISFLSFPALAQTVLKQRVERYLFSSYDMTKASLKENERLAKMLEDKVDEYVLLLNKEELSRFKIQEKEFDQYFTKLESVTDYKMMHQMVEESKRSHHQLLASVLQRGVKNLEEAGECQKLIAFLLMEKELLRKKNEVLVALLKDDYSRSKFVETFLASGNFTDETDTKSLMVKVDLNLVEFDI